jgi:hypothetical protein
LRKYQYQMQRKTSDSKNKENKRLLKVAKKEVDNIRTTNDVRKNIKAMMKIEDKFEKKAEEARFKIIKFQEEYTTLTREKRNVYIKETIIPNLHKAVQKENIGDKNNYINLLPFDLLPIIMIQAESFLDMINFILTSKKNMTYLLSNQSCTVAAIFDKMNFMKTNMKLTPDVTEIFTLLESIKEVLLKTGKCTIHLLLILHLTTKLIEDSGLRIRHYNKYTKHGWHGDSVATSAFIRCNHIFIQEKQPFFLANMMTKSGAKDIYYLTSTEFRNKKTLGEVATKISDRLAKIDKSHYADLNDKLKCQDDIVNMISHHELPELSLNEANEWTNVNDVLVFDTKSNTLELLRQRLLQKNVFVVVNSENTPLNKKTQSELHYDTFYCSRLASYSYGLKKIYRKEVSLPKQEIIADIKHNITCLSSNVECI